jgi:hypothetical protein
VTCRSISSSGYSAAPKNQEAWITLAIGACIVVIMTGLSAAMPSPAARSEESEPESEPAMKRATKPQLPPEVIAALNRNGRIASGAGAALSDQLFDLDRVTGAGRHLVAIKSLLTLFPPPKLLEAH